MTVVDTTTIPDQQNRSLCITRQIGGDAFSSMLNARRQPGQGVVVSDPAGNGLIVTSAALGYLQQVASTVEQGKLTQEFLQLTLPADLAPWFREWYSPGASAVGQIVEDVPQADETVYFRVQIWTPNDAFMIGQSLHVEMIERGRTGYRRVEQQADHASYRSLFGRLFTPHASVWPVAASATLLEGLREALGRIVSDEIKENFLEIVLEYPAADPRALFHLHQHRHAPLVDGRVLLRPGESFTQENGQRVEWMSWETMKRINRELWQQLHAAARSYLLAHCPDLAHLLQSQTANQGSNAL